MHISLQHYTTHVKAVLFHANMKISLLCVLLFYTYLHMVSWFWNTLVGTWSELTVFCITYRSSSLEPEGTPSSKSKPRERIIPIHVERDANESSTVSSPPAAKPSIQGQRSVSYRYCPQTYAYIQQHSVTIIRWFFPEVCILY
jgi:hypothetical protein